MILEEELLKLFFFAGILIEDEINIDLDKIRNLWTTDKDVTIANNNVSTITFKDRELYDTAGKPK
tara:strand:- start:311 stop:505 length:195 start_codon:yes stop_codon:yes gene_type:complete